MKGIIRSVGTAAFAVAVLVIGATGAFFSDTEVSAGNVFTAGTLDLKIDSNAAVLNGIQNIMGWGATDLTTEKYFNFPNVVPGDRGVRHISLHNDSSDSVYVCFFSEPTTNAGNAGDEIMAVAWQEVNPDLKYRAVGAGAETLLTPTPVGIKDLNNVIFADSDEGSPIPALATHRMAVAWCAGTMTINPAGDPNIFPGESGSTIECDGSGMTTQGGSYIADMIFYAEQVANNPTFQCSNVALGGGSLVTVTSGSLATSPAQVISNPQSWLFYNDTNDTVMTLNQFSADSGVNDIVIGPGGVSAAQMTLHNGVSPRYNIATYGFAGTMLSSITSMKYRVYDTSAGTPPFLHFNVSLNGTDTWQGRLVQVPSVPVNTWTEVNALSGMWTKTSGNWPVGVNTAAPFSGSTARSWADIIADYPNAKIRDTDSFFGVRVGHPGPVGETGYVDWIEFNGTKYDF